MPQLRLSEWIVPPIVVPLLLSYSCSQLPHYIRRTDHS